MVRGRAYMAVGTTGEAVNIPAAELAEDSIPTFALPNGEVAFASADLAKRVLDGLPVIRPGPFTAAQLRVIEDVRRKCDPLLSKPAEWWQDAARRTPDLERYFARLIVAAAVVSPRALRAFPSESQEDVRRRCAFGLVVGHWSAGSTLGQAQVCCAWAIEPAAVASIYADLTTVLVRETVAEAEAALRYIFSAPVPTPTPGPLARFKRFVRRPR